MKLVILGKMEDNRMSVTSLAWLTLQQDNENVFSFTSRTDENIHMFFIVV
jgi:hypothetical protein